MIDYAMKQLANDKHCEQPDTLKRPPLKTNDQKAEARKQMAKVSTTNQSIVTQYQWCKYPTFRRKLFMLRMTDGSFLRKTVKANFSIIREDILKWRTALQTLMS